MKKAALMTIYLLGSCCVALAQKLTFAYDSAGNQSVRQLELLDGQGQIMSRKAAVPAPIAGSMDLPSRVGLAAAGGDTGQGRGKGTGGSQHHQREVRPAESADILDSGTRGTRAPVWGNKAPITGARLWRVPRASVWEILDSGTRGTRAPVWGNKAPITGARLWRVPVLNKI